MTHFAAFELSRAHHAEMCAIADQHRLASVARSCVRRRRLRAQRLRELLGRALSPAPGSGPAAAGLDQRPLLVTGVRGDASCVRPSEPS